MQTYITIGVFVYSQDEFGRPYGWDIAEYTTPEMQLGPDFVTSAYRRKPEGLRERILAHLRGVLPEVQTDFKADLMRAQLSGQEKKRRRRCGVKGENTMSVSVEKKPFGMTKDGEAVSVYCIKNEALAVGIMEYGAAIRSLRVHHGGAWTDAVLGYDTLREYEENDGYLGACIGRVGNRIGGAVFTLNGKDYRLAGNDGENHLHGGLRGFDKYVWQGTEEPDGVRFTRVSLDGEEGYPGTLTVSVKFSWQGDGLMLHYTARCDQDTILNLTNHSYFNLDGEGTVQEQLLKIHADHYTPNDAGCLPTGELAPVAGTAMDFRSFKPIGKDADSDEPCVKPFRGYDVNFCLDGSVPAIEAKSLKSGIVMYVTTDQPGVQLFTANHMKERIGKNGQKYGHRSAFCLETQHFPDCIHHPDWPSCVLRAGEVFDSKTIYSFTTE